MSDTNTTQPTAPAPATVSVDGEISDLQTAVKNLTLRVSALEAAVSTFTAENSAADLATLAASVTTLHNHIFGANG
jgi:hypothetical protein